MMFDFVSDHLWSSWLSCIWSMLFLPLCGPICRGNHIFRLQAHVDDMLWMMGGPLKAKVLHILDSILLLLLHLNFKKRKRNAEKSGQRDCQRNSQIPNSLLSFKSQGMWWEMTNGVKERDTINPRAKMVATSSFKNRIFMQPMQWMTQYAPRRAHLFPLKAEGFPKFPLFPNMLPNSLTLLSHNLCPKLKLHNV